MREVVAVHHGREYLCWLTHAAALVAQLQAQMLVHEAFVWFLAGILNRLLVRAVVQAEVAQLEQALQELGGVRLLIQAKFLFKLLRVIIFE